MQTTPLTTDEVKNLRSEEAGSIAEHRTAHAWIRSGRMSERETLLQIHSVLIDILEALKK